VKRVGLEVADHQLALSQVLVLGVKYLTAPALVSDAWKAYAKGAVMTDRNAFQKFNLSNLRDQADLTDKMVMSPGALGGLPPTTITTTPGSGQLTVDCTAPSVLPSGWTIARAIFGIIKDQDPQTEAEYVITTDDDATSTYQAVFTGLDTVPYLCGAWFEWNRPDAKLAYSPSLQEMETPS